MFFNADATGSVGVSPAVSVESNQKHRRVKIYVFSTSRGRDTHAPRGIRTVFTSGPLVIDYKLIWGAVLYRTSYLMNWYFYLLSNVLFADSTDFQAKCSIFIFYEAVWPTIKTWIVPWIYLFVTWKRWGIIRPVIWWNPIIFSSSRE